MSLARHEVCPTDGRGSAYPLPSTAEIIELAWENVQRRVAAELAAAKAMFPDIEEQAAQAAAARRNAPLLRLKYETRNIRVKGQWPGGQSVEFTACYSRPIGSAADDFKAEAIRQSVADMGEGYQWEATII